MKLLRIKLTRHQRQASLLSVVRAVQAQSLMTLFNLVVDRVAQDDAYLRSTLAQVCARLPCAVSLHDLCPGIRKQQHVGVVSCETRFLQYSRPTIKFTPL